ncbi:MAG: hypothetical protein IPP99_05205 [Chitinophagaceae bacterium]|nr:hypothetical protein [Chitinophagaceae bacterium]
MKRITFLLFCLILCSTCFSQKDWDSIIVVHAKDSANLVRRVRHALINMDFIVKDLDSDTLKTYPREFETNSVMIATAMISGQEVILKAVWGSRKQDYFGSSTAPRNYQRVYYYKRCVEWQILFLVAQAIGGEISFRK